MSNATDMSTPVTRGELEGALKKLATKAELQATVKKLATKAELQAAVKKLATKAELQAAVKELATKADLERFATKADLEQLATRTRADLEIWGGALHVRIERVEQFAEKFQTQLVELDRKLIERLDRLSTELASHANAHHELTSTMIASIDDKYKELPRRVNRLEATVFPTEQR